MKGIIQKKMNVTSRFGWAYMGHVESTDGTTAMFIDTEGQTHTLRARYLVGCDGGSSSVRKAASIKMVGGQMCKRPPPLPSQELNNIAPIPFFP